MITRLTQLFPLWAILLSFVVALNATRLNELALVVVSAVVLHNLSGLASGYWVARILGYDGKTCRTLAIEVGMQNSGLAVALASKYFGAAAALPGALFSIWHNLSGSLLAAIWAGRTR